MTDKFAEFLKIASQLNKLGIIPLLMGSLGLEQVTGQDWQARDIDIHVHGDERGWEAPDKEDLSIEFGAMETLEAFSGVPIAELTRKEVEGVQFLLPTAEQFLAIYRASSRDSYRNENNNHKDFAKIAYLEKMTK